MNSLAETNPRPTGRTYTCKVATVIAQDPDVAGAMANVAAQFADEENSDRALADWLKVSENVVTKHRNNACACAR